jgi:hypothetical protein
MIVSKIQGGLANQMFQWAYGKNLSLTHDINFYLDISFYKNQFGSTYRQFSLNKFPNLEYKIFQNNWHEDDKFDIKVLNDDLVFRQLNYSDTSHFYLNGYWQSEKFFYDNKETIIQCLNFNSGFIEKIQIKYPHVFNYDVVSMHIRRTDYTTSNGYHPVQPISYYEQSLEILGDYDYLYIFSDDIDWCKSNIKFKNVVFIEELEDVEDLWLMSLCKHNIIANSSFSWWGAWLNNNRDKKVIAPKKWFGDHVNLNTSDLLPYSWIKI